MYFIEKQRQEILLSYFMVLISNSRKNIRTIKLTCLFILGVNEIYMVVYCLSPVEQSIVIYELK